MDNLDSFRFDGQKRKLTVFFSDIADFTATTDDLESEELTSLLNHYLTEMSKIALDHGATIAEGLLAVAGHFDELAATVEKMRARQAATGRAP